MSDILFLPLLGVVTAMLSIPFLKPKPAAWSSLVCSMLIAICSLIPALQILITNTAISTSFVTSLGDFSLIADPLSAWFIVVINIVVLAGMVYGQEYLKHYRNRPVDLKVHLVLLPVFHASMIFATLFDDFFCFIIIWEIMSLSSFMLILLERQKEGTLKAAINYFVQMHVSVMFLFAGTFYLNQLTGGSSFSDLAALPQQTAPGNALVVFVLFFVGFGIKAGFIPFHTWLPEAHPAAPTHLSGIMSGVFIKVGIYGIIRLVIQTPASMINIGWIIMIVGVASGLYGVMFAIVQHNLKKLLAYHSIENIGIIGIGIGMGALGIGYEDPALTFLGFAGALLHTLNHSLFKSLLFFSAGNVYQATETIIVEQLGGLGKKMPFTSVFFLIGAIAICGLPPLNGFISEFIIYLGLFQSISSFGFAESVVLLIVISALAFIGGLAMLCFTKAFGVVFQGTPRTKLPVEPVEAGWLKLAPMAVITALIIFIGLFPASVFKVLSSPLGMIVSPEKTALVSQDFVQTLSGIARMSAMFLVLVLAILLLKKRVQKNVVIQNAETWGCGYVAPNAKMQYTANSFARTYRKLFRPIVVMKKNKVDIKQAFPVETYSYHSHSSDFVEDKLIAVPIKKAIQFLGKLRLFQNGQTQSYLMYGFLFIIIVLIIELFK